MSIEIQMFRLNGKLINRKFFHYKIQAKGDVTNFFQISGKAKYALSRINRNNPVFNDEENLYSLEELKEIPEVEKCLIQPAGLIELPVKGNKKVYADFLNVSIRNNLVFNNGNKYKREDSRDVISFDILTRSGQYEKFNNKKEITLARCFTITPVIKDDGTVFLEVVLKNFFVSNKTIYDCMRDNKDVLGWEIKCIWVQHKPTGFITEILTETIEDKLDELRGQSLIEYHINKKESYRIDKFTDEDRNAKVVKVRLKNKKDTYCYIPHSLRPVLTRDKVKSLDPNFSRNIDKLTKMEMNYRFKILEDFIKDIGKIEQIGGLEFDCLSSKNIENFGFKYKEIKPPLLIGAGGKKCTRTQVFRYGYYKKPKDKVKVGIIYPENVEKDAKEALGRLWTFNTKGYVRDNYYVFNNSTIKKLEKDISENGLETLKKLINTRYSKAELIELLKKLKINKDDINTILGKSFCRLDTSCEKLMELDFEGMDFSKYSPGDITKYKEIAYSLKRENIDLILCVVPDDISEDNPYCPFKEVMAELKIPSQMISINAINKINNCNNISNLYSYTGLYYLQNISLGMLGKTGGIPWIIEDIGGEVDCFIGLDVGNPGRNKIRYPSCSILFDRDGTIISYFRPKKPQSGEKIQERILQDIFDRILISYRDKYGEYPKHIIIHRDGSSNEELDWYKKYFGTKEIKFDIVEVKKSGSIRFGELVEKEIYNPVPGSYITYGIIAYLVTTDISPHKKNDKNYFLGSPNPLKIEKIYGETKLEDIVKQIYYLSEIHIGSIKSTRLPVTTGYADKISKIIDYIPEGEIENRLFFL